VAMIKFVCVIPLLLLIAACSGDKKTPVADDSIPETSLTEAGFDTVLINKMTKAVRQHEYSNIHSVLIARKGKLVYEEYFSGPDEILGTPQGDVTFTSETLHDIRSISKSVVSACIGICIDQGLIRNVNESVFTFFPELVKYKEGPRADLTIEHLLSMTSGIKWNEDVPYNDPENSEVLMAQSSDPVEYVLSQPMDTVPGTVWKYNGGTTQLLASIIKKLSNMEVDEFARVHLFSPLGITEYEWTKYPGTSMPMAASGVRLRPRDMMKFALMYYHGGKALDGKQVISKAWVNASFETHIARPNNEGYGYQWWIWNDQYHGDTVRMVVGVGNGNQRIFFNKDADLIVVTTAGDYNQWTLPKHPATLLRDFIYPAIR
jgi:CubicO group peptidase (beta-lactamase class C family)